MAGNTDGLELPADLNELPDGWKFLPLASLVDEDRGISYGVVQPGSDAHDGVPIVRVNNISHGRIDVSDALRISADIEAKYARTRLRGGEVVLTLVGSLGESAVVPDELAGWNVARAVGVIPVRQDIGPRWVELCLRSKTSQHYIRTWATTTVQATLNLRDVARLPIPLPPKRVREAIVHVLGTLDDRIDLNRRMNQTLEAITRAIFTSWFVDFRPVRAEAEGRDPGLPQHLADLFPGSFEESELGEIPAGWSIARLGDVARQRVGRVNPSAETQAMPYVPIDCISPKSLFLSQSNPGDDAKSSLTRFYKHDILFGAMRPYFHKVCIAPFDGTTRTTAFVLFPASQEDFSYVTLLLHDAETIEYATRHSTGSTIPYAQWSGSLAEMPIVLPPTQIRASFNYIVRPLLMRIPARYFENRTLATLRDTLLPKLISGGLRIKDAERIRSSFKSSSRGCSTGADSSTS